MANEISLNCSILGPDFERLFLVKISRGEIVAALKNAIKQEKQVGLAHLNANKLDLWKLQNPLSEDDIVRTLRGVVDGKKIPGVLLLEPLEELSFYFPECPAPNKLHLVIGVPPCRGLLASSSESSSETLIIRPFNFRVRSPSGRWRGVHHLTHFNLPRLNPLNIKILLVRKEYELAYDSITQCAEVTRAVYLITGQPGIGKTMFLLYLLVRLLGERKSVALQFSARRYVLFNEQGINIRNGESPDSSGILAGMWVLSDSMGADEIQPCSAFRFSEMCLVHTSAPAARNWKDWTKQLSATRHVMDLWTEEEFQRLLSVSGSNIHRGLELFSKYGSDIEVITGMLLKPVNEEQYIADIRVGAAIFVDMPSETVLDLQGLNHQHDLSSNIFAIRPEETPQTTCLTIPTTFLQETLAKALSRTAASKRHEAFMLLRNHRSLCGTAGWVFEHTAHITLSNPNRPPLPIYIGGEVGPTIPPAKNMISGSTALKTIQMPFDFYWRPQETNFRGVDALIRHDNDIWVLRYTISPRHGTATEGLKEVCRHMNHKRLVTWHLVILGSHLSDAESARSGQQLADGWDKEAKVYASELPTVRRRA